MLMVHIKFEAFFVGALLMLAAAIPVWLTVTLNTRSQANHLALINILV